MAPIAFLEPEAVVSNPLSPGDIQILNRVLVLVNGGKLAVAAQAIVQVSANAMSHPDALFVAAQLLIAQGRIADAQRTLEGAIDMAPDNAHLWNALGNLFNRIGELAQAETAFARAAQIAPGIADFWLNLGNVQIGQNRFVDAQAALDRAQKLVAGDPRLAQLQGLCAQGMGDAAGAAGHYRAALKLAPHDIDARHNLASALRAAGDYGAALAELDLISSTLPPATASLRGHLLAHLGRYDEAVAQYRATIRSAPDWLDAHEALSRLLPQIGGAGQALDGYRQALSIIPDHRPLWDSAIAAAKEFKASAQLSAWCAAARKRFGDDLFLMLAQAIGAGLSGDCKNAIAQLLALAGQFPEEAGIRNHLTPLLIAEGDYAAAEHHAREAVRLAPHDQSGWAWLSIIWRLRSDQREYWLADYDQLVMPIDLALSEQAIDLLAGKLTSLHTTMHHPAEQSLRGGTQTRGNLFDSADSDIGTLAGLIKAGINQRLAGLSPDPKHPFLSRLTGDIAFAGSWSARLASAGFHINHIHQSGWLSSALYIDLPPEVSHPAPSLEHMLPGSLGFGVPDDMLGLSLSPRRIIVPKVAQLVVFPSYFWHGTLPFESNKARLTIAFDALPLANPAI